MDSKIMVKRSFLLFIGALVLFTVGIQSLSMAQFRKDANNTAALMGPVVKEDPSEGANLGNLFNMQMDHSYSMMFSSFGGQMHNINAYTNTMRFFFSEKLTGRVDLSLLHSPFGNSFMSQNKGLDAQVILRNAQLNYQLSDKSSISIQVQQLPQSYYYGMGPWGAGGFYESSPFYARHNIFD